MFDVGGGPLAHGFPVGLWTSGGTLLASTTVTNANSTALASSSPLGVWLATPIAPLTLAPGDYVLGEFGSTADLAAALATATTIPGVTFTGAVGSPGGSLGFPSTPQAVNAGVFGPNLALVTVPEPSTLALLALGGGALAGWRRWRKRRQAQA
jgi:hypothetical protein